MNRQSSNTIRRVWNNRRALISMCSDCSEMLVLASMGRPDLFWSVNTLARSVTKWMTKHCLVWSTISVKPQTRGSAVMWKITLTIATLVYSEMRHLQVTCGIQNQRREAYCAYLEQSRLFQFHGCARSKPQFPTAVPSLRLFRWTQVYEWTVCQRFSLGNAYWKHCLVKQPRETLNVMNAMKSFRLIHLLMLVSLSRLTAVRPTSPTVHIQPNCASAKTTRHRSKRSIKDEAQTQGVSQERTESIWIVRFR